MASICNDERVLFGVMSGHERKTLRLPGQQSVDACLGFFRPLEHAFAEFDVPAAPEVEIAETEQASAGRLLLRLAPGTPPQRVLVVDDWPESRQLLVRSLAPLGFELKEAGNGLEAVEQAMVDLREVDAQTAGALAPMLQNFQYARVASLLVEHPHT